MSDGMNWFDDHVTRIEVARWLEERNRFMDQAEVIDYFDKPWKWTPEYRTWVESKLLDAMAVSEEHRA